MELVSFVEFLLGKKRDVTRSSKFHNTFKVENCEISINTANFIPGWDL